MGCSLILTLTLVFYTLGWTLGTLVHGPWMQVVMLSSLDRNRHMLNKHIQ